MKYLIPVLCLSVVFCGFLPAEDREPLYLKKIALEDSVYFVQIQSIPDERTQKREILSSSARQIAMRTSVFVRYIVTDDSGSDTVSTQKTSVLLDYDQEDAAAIEQSLEIIDLHRSGGTVQALVRTHGARDFQYRHISVSSRIKKSGNPGWVSKPPKSSKYYAVVGSFSAESEAHDGFLYSDSEAFGALTVFVGKPIVSGKTRLYETVLEGAYITRRWYNPKENRYYSLAVLPLK